MKDSALPCPALPTSFVVFIYLAFLTTLQLLTKRYT
jgi:hypothetical protein